MALTGTFFVITSIAFYLGYILGKKTMEESFLKDSFEIDFNQDIHPTVKNVYDVFISHEGYKHFEEGVNTLKIPLLGLTIWTASDWSERDFLIGSCDENLTYKFYNKSIKAINEELTALDKKILDRIAKEIRINSQETASVLFLEETLE